MIPIQHTVTRILASIFQTTFYRLSQKCWLSYALVNLKVKIIENDTKL